MGGEKRVSTFILYINYLFACLLKSATGYEEFSDDEITFDDHEFDNQEVCVLATAILHSPPTSCPAPFRPHPLVCVGC